MFRQKKARSSSNDIIFFQCCFWLALAIAVSGCDALSFNAAGLGGIIEPQQNAMANNESYALIGERNLDVDADRGVIANDADATRVDVTATSGTTFGGSLELFEDGSFTYAAPDDFFGTDSFVYRVEVDGEMMTGTASIKVYPADATPIP